MESCQNDYERRIFGAMNFISRHIEEELSLERIAREACFSPYHFHRIFKALTSESLGSYCRRIRLETAANRLMSRPEETLTRIALDTGFSSSQNFAKSFRGHFGLSASEYRKTRRKGAPFPPMDIRFPEVSPGFMTQAFVRDLPPLTLAYIRALGPYAPETCAPAFAEITRWAGTQGLLEPGRLHGIYWDNPEVTPPALCRFDAALSVPAGLQAETPVFLQEFPGGPYALCRFEASHDEIDRAWDEAFLWVCRNQHECRDTPAAEVYLRQPEETGEGKWLLDIRIPLREKRPLESAEKRAEKSYFPESGRLSQKARMEKP